MALTARARDALRPTNSIEPVPTPKPVQGQSRTSPTDPGSIVAVPYTSEPESIAKAYYVEQKDGERRYFDDYQRKAIAMRATDTSISSKREDLNTVRAMLDIASARGWQSIEIRGSAEFKREAWIEASVRGLEGRGYSPNDLDRQEADRRAAERREENAVRTVTREAHNAGKTASAAQPSVEAREKQSADPAPTTIANNRQTIRDAQKELSADGRVILAALSEKIDRQMNRLNTAAKTEIKAFVGAELVKKERAEGPTVLSSEMKRAARSPEPSARPAVPAPTGRQIGAESPRRTLGR